MSDLTLTRSLLRFQALLTALCDGQSLSRAELFERLGDAYPNTDSRRPMVDRDIKQLRQLGIVIDVSNTRPPLYVLRGSAPMFSDDELRTLALIRDTFSQRHPQAAHVAALIERLTSGLNEQQQALFNQQQVSRVRLDPAIDYRPYAKEIAWLEQAISRHWIISFRYLPTSKSTPTIHERIEPSEIEYHDRHFYLVGYSFATHQMIEFRIDRIQPDYRQVARQAPDMAHERKPISFRYRLAAALARGELSQRFENQRIIERLANGDVIIEAEGWNAFFIVRGLLRYAGNAEVLEPPALRQQMIEAVAQLAANYKPGMEER